jgi:hypothetical protein
MKQLATLYHEAKKEVVCVKTELIQESVVMVL